MSDHLHLQFKFIDRAGRDVFEIYNADDNKRLENCLGVLRLPIAGDGEIQMAWKEDTETRLKKDWSEPEQLELPLEGGE